MPRTTAGAVGARPTIRDIAPWRRVQGLGLLRAQRPAGGLGGDARAHPRDRHRAGVAAQRGRPLVVRARAGAVGLAVARDVHLLEEEPYYMRFIAGMESVLPARGCPCC